MNVLKKILFFLLVIAGYTLSGLISNTTLIAHAQIPSSITGVEINVNPELPQPGDTVAVEVKSYITDLNGASVAWYVNQKLVFSGIGKTKYTFTAPKDGSRSNISALITTIEGRQIQKNTSVQANGVDLFVETSGYTPPFYLGKASVAYQNQVKIIAVPHLINTNGVEIDPKKLIYNWKRDSKVLQDQSGFGKQAAIVTGNIVPRPYTITVDVSSLDGKTHGQTSLDLEETSPSIVLYENDPLYGVLYNNAISERFRMNQSELSVIAAPFGFNIKDSNSIDYVWSING
ncbi:MAG: hypothetical protein RL641_608, partial [Candidatus Parcubacteria bacterium]